VRVGETTLEVVGLKKTVKLLLGQVSGTSVNNPPVIPV